MLFRPLSHVEQVAAHLRAELEQGRWTGEMPGVFKLEEYLGVNHGILHRALHLLEQEGVLENQGRGKSRRIVMSGSGSAKLTVRVLLYERPDLWNSYLLDLMHLLRGEGHDAGFADKTLSELGMNVGRISRFVKAQEADAWVVVAGPHDVLEWFSRQPEPAFALYGLTKDIPLPFAGPRKIPAIGELLGCLFELGHSRIVQLVREERRKPKLGGIERFILGEMEQRGITTGPYNIPDWGNCPAELQEKLDSLFKHTPPTALLVDEPAIYLAVRDHLARRGICCPEQVSLACFDADPAFDWLLPQVTHIAWDPRPVIRAVVRWVNRVGKGRNDRRATLTKARLVMGGTIGPIAKSR